MKKITFLMIILLFGCCKNSNITLSVFGEKVILPDNCLLLANANQNDLKLSCNLNLADKMYSMRLAANEMDELIKKSEADPYFSISSEAGEHFSYYKIIMGHRDKEPDINVICSPEQCLSINSNDPKVYKFIFSQIDQNA